MCEPYPIHINISYQPKLSFSKLSYNHSILIFLLCNFYNTLSANLYSTPNIADSWYSLYEHPISCLILQTFMPLELPLFFPFTYCSSFNYAENSYQKSRDKTDYSRLPDRHKHVTNYIELDKCLFVKILDLRDPKECFKILISLRTTQNYPTTMYLGDESSSSVVGKAIFFSIFFGPVYSAKQCYQPFHTANNTVLSDMVPDGIPSFVLHQSCVVIAPLVYQLFKWICDRKFDQRYEKYHL